MPLIYQNSVLDLRKPVFGGMQQHSPISAFIIGFLESITSKHATGDSQSM